MRGALWAHLTVGDYVVDGHGHEGVVVKPGEHASLVVEVTKPNGRVRAVTGRLWPHDTIVEREARSFGHANMVAVAVCELLSSNHRMGAYWSMRDDELLSWLTILLRSYVLYGPRQPERAS